MVMIFQDMALHILGFPGEGMSIWFIGNIVQGFNHCILTLWRLIYACL